MLMTKSHILHETIIFNDKHPPMFNKRIKSLMQKFPYYEKHFAKTDTQFRNNSRAYLKSL